MNMYVYEHVENIIDAHWMLGKARGAVNYTNLSVTSVGTKIITKSYSPTNKY